MAKKATRRGEEKQRCSSSDEGHDALLSLYHQRYTEQNETEDADAKSCGEWRSRLSSTWD
jgi:hypothetical protein